MSDCNYSTYLSPSKARFLPANSRERSIASHSLRQAWHYIFDYCPRLLALYPPSGKDFLDGFLDHIETANIGLTWKIFLLILEQHKQANTLTAELSSELIMAAAIRWTISDLSKAQSIFIIEKNFGLSVFGEKAPSIDADKTFKVILHDNTDSTNDIFFSVSTSRHMEDHDHWEILTYA